MSVKELSTEEQVLYWQEIELEELNIVENQIPTILGYEFDKDPAQLWKDCNRDIVVFMQELSAQLEGEVLLCKIKPDHTATPSGFSAPTYLVTSSNTLLDKDAMWTRYRKSSTHHLVNANVECDRINPLRSTDTPGVFEYTPWMGRVD